MTLDEDGAYEREQRHAIEKWKNAEPSLFERAFGIIAAPIGWLFQKLIPPAAIEGALIAADWAAQYSLSAEWILKQSGVESLNELGPVNTKH